MLCMFVGLTWPFLMCYSATSATRSMTNLGDIVYNSNWYLYPEYLRKYSIMIIARSQRTIYFTGFQMVRCTLEVFQGVRIAIHRFEKMLLLVMEMIRIFIWSFSVEQQGSILLYYVPQYIFSLIRL